MTAHLSKVPPTSLNQDSTAWFKAALPTAKRRRWRLLCLPYAGGSANVFRHWHRYLPADVDVVAVQYPGREERMSEARPPSVQSLAAGLADALDCAGGHGPYAIFGHSLGALVGFELAREMRRRGSQPPLHLFISGASGPHVNAHATAPRHLWADPEFIDELERMKGTPPELLREPELIRLLLPTLRLDLGLVDTYACGNEPPLDVPMDAIGGLDDAQVPRDGLSQWSVESRAGFRMTMFAGDHFFLHPMAPLICGLITERVDSALHAAEQRA